jgi:hypothetical protein
MGTIKTTNIQSISGSGTVTLGTSGETLALGSNVTVTGNGLVGITAADQWRLTANLTMAGSATIISANWEQTDTDGFGNLGSAMSESSGIFTFPSTGIWLIRFNMWVSSLDSDYAVGYIYTTTNNSTYNQATATVASGTTTPQNNNAMTEFMFDVTNTSTHKVAFYQLREGSNATIKADTADSTQTGATFIRLGDT